MYNCDLSCNTKKYLDEYSCILNQMINGINNARLTNSISHNFIVQMIPHHEAAIQMSKNLLKYTTNLALQNIASNIISEQTRSIERMRIILCCCAQERNSRQCLCKYKTKTDEILKTMFSQMSCAESTNNIDCNFIREMIPHHMGAVRLCENALQYDICSELTPILKNIISSQKRGIIQMKRLYSQLCCK